MTDHLIDPPLPFAPTRELQEFLARLESRPDKRHPDIQSAIKQAREQLADPRNRALAAKIHREQSATQIPDLE